MTLVAAFCCKDGILIAADREEASGNAKRSVTKIIPVSFGIDFAVLVASAGNAATADLATSRLAARLEGVENFAELKAKREEIIGNIVASVYRDFIWKNPDRERSELDFSLLIAINSLNTEEQFLYRTAGIVPQPIAGHICIGVGEDLANYFADRLYAWRMDRRELMLLTVFIFRETKRAVRDVGQGTDICFVFKRAGVFGSGGKTIESLEADLPPFKDVIKAFWSDVKLMPEWLKDERLDMRKMRDKATKEWAREKRAKPRRHRGQ